MGGDHKCPVCQATFTRPQHVARHMRSHTGDRPYKCQHCGDQFARSDLLARHINKCHANEKPLPNAASGGRRKGSVAASRATTSKQACDQCVQSSLPCDGSIPCSKCVSRKCRCTYVKFHRQTAPSGPGHHAPRSPSSSSSSLSGSVGPPNHLDGPPLLAPPFLPPVTSATFSSADQIFHTPFTFNPATPAYPSSWTTADMSQMPFSMASDVDLSAKQVDLLRRAGPSILSNSPTTVLPNLYMNQHHQPPSSNWYPSWGEPGTYPPSDDTKPFDGVARTHSLTSSEPASFGPEFYAGLIGTGYRPRKMSLDFSDSSSATSQSVPSSATSSSVHLPLPGNEIYDGSEELPRHTQEGHILQHQRRGSMPTSQPPHFPPSSEAPSQPNVTTTQQPHRQGSFSSAFGLMSIDDPNMLAGLSSSDGVSFFSNLGMGLLPHSPNATPMPTRMSHAQSAHLGRERGMSHAQSAHLGRERGMSLGTLPTPGLSSKEAGEARELKDMWKSFVRSPLSGSGSGALDLPSLGQMPQSPSGQRRRMRVSSLPSVTPTVEKGQPLMASERHGESGVGGGAAGNGNAVRTTMHGNGDDLRSYQAAVNARCATSLKLNLVPRRKGTRPSLRASPPKGSREDVSSLSVATGAGQGGQQGISRPSSSSSTSSLAQAFTVPSPSHHHHHHHHHAHGSGLGVVKPPPMQGASISLPVPPSMSGLHSMSHSHPYHGGIGLGSSASLTFEPGSRASSVTSDGTGTGGSGSDGEVSRPSFKRYASQTLGPPSSKRAMVERGNGHGGSKNVKVDKGVKGGMGQGTTSRNRNGRGDEEMECFEGGVGGRSPGSRLIAALPERAKRV